VLQFSATLLELVLGAGAVAQPVVIATKVAAMISFFMFVIIFFTVHASPILYMKNVEEPHETRVPIILFN
jgi:hypothetical protein